LQPAEFKKINTDIGDVAISKLERHLWYLGPRLVPLALFTDNLTLNEKVKIRDAIKKNSHEALESTDRCLKLIASVKFYKKSSVVLLIQRQ
jgi:hypothetical protein